MSKCTLIAPQNLINTAKCVAHLNLQYSVSYTLDPQPTPPQMQRQIAFSALRSQKKVSQCYDSSGKKCSPVLRKSLIKPGGVQKGKMGPRLFFLTLTRKEEDLFFLFVASTCTTKRNTKLSRGSLVY